MSIYPKIKNDSIANFLGLAPMPEDKLKEILDEPIISSTPPEVLSELARKAQNNKERVANRTHHWLKENGGGVAQREYQNMKLAEGDHLFLDGEFQRNNQLKLIEEGRHVFLGPAVNRKRLDEGTHQFLDSEFQRRNVMKRVNDGTHNLVGGVTCRDRQGNIVQVPTEIYRNQKEVTTDMTQWEYVVVSSKEAKRRKTLQI